MRGRGSAVERPNICQVSRKSLTLGLSTSAYRLLLAIWILNIYRSKRRVFTDFMRTFMICVQGALSGTRNGTSVDVLII